MFLPGHPLGEVVSRALLMVLQPKETNLKNASAGTQFKLLEEQEARRVQNQPSENKHGSRPIDSICGVKQPGTMFVLTTYSVKSGVEPACSAKVMSECHASTQSCSVKKSDNHNFLL